MTVAVPPPTWTPSDPATRVVSDEDVVAQLAWPQDWCEGLSSRRARGLADLERLVRLGLPVRVAAGVRRFDPYEVIFFMRWAHHRLGDPLWGEAVIATRQGASEFLAGESSAAAGDATDSAIGFDVELRREVNLESRRAGSRFRTHLPLPVEDRDQRELVIRTVEHAGVRLTRDDIVLDVRAIVPADPPRVAVIDAAISLRVGWRGEVPDPAKVEPFRAPAPDTAPFLAAAEGPLRVTDRVRRIALEVAGDARTPWDAVRRFWAFLFQRLVIGRIHPHTLAADDRLAATLDTGFSDCFHGAALLVAMCRARGIPARVVSGQFLYAVCATNHNWAEILIPPYGWVPCDLWSWILADGDPDSEWADRFLGRVDPRLVIERLPRTRLILDVASARPSYALQQPWLTERGPGVEIAVRDFAHGTLIYRDRISVRRSSLPAAVRGSDATHST